MSANVIYGYHGYANAQGDEYLIALAKINHSIESTFLKNHTALRNIHHPMENNLCAVLIYLYCPHKYSITHQKLIVQLIVISTPGFTHTKKLHCIYHNTVLF